MKEKMECIKKIGKMLADDIFELKLDLIRMQENSSIETVWAVKFVCSQLEKFLIRYYDCLSDAKNMPED